MREKCTEKNTHINNKAETKQAVVMATLKPYCGADTKEDSEKEGWLGRQSTSLQEKDAKVLHTGPASQESCVSGVAFEGCGRPECLVVGTMSQLCLLQGQLPKKDLSRALLWPQNVFCGYFHIISKFTVALLLNIAWTLGNRNTNSAVPAHHIHSPFGNPIH